NDYSQMLFMLRKQPFMEDQIRDISTNWTQANPIILPGGVAPPLIADVLAGRKTLSEYDRESPRFVGAVWDDSPFYFAIDRPFGMPATIAARLMKWLLGPSMGMLAIFAVFGMPRKKRKNGIEISGRQTSSGSAYAGSLIYFAALGFGFIAVELALLQNL